MSSRSMFRARSAMRDVLEAIHFERDVGVAERQVEVDEGDGVVRVGGQRGAEVHREASCVPTPPREPRTATIEDATRRLRGWRLPPTISMLLSLLAQGTPQGGQHVFEGDRVRQEVLGALLERLEQRLVIVADGEDGELRVLDGEQADHLQGLLLVRVEGDDGQVGHRRWK